MRNAATGTLFFAIAVVLGLPGFSTIAVAQEAEELEEIMVTARKREESLQDIPISITAFTADEIDRAGFKTLEDLSLQVAGLQYSSQGGQLPGRFSSSLRFRGMNVNNLSEDPSKNVGTLFLDGIYVLGGTHSIPFEEVERVEVIKGPQSAFFGRTTFGGAVNYITKTPSLETWNGRVTGSGGFEYDEYDVTGTLEGPIVKDVLGMRVSARYYDREGIWDASDGGELGEQESQSISGTLFWQMGSRMTWKARAFYAEDDDGPPSGGLIPGVENDSCTGKTINTNDPDNPVAMPTQYICGTVPKNGQAVSILGDNRVIDSNTNLDPDLELFTILGADKFLDFGAAQNGINDQWLEDNIVRRPIPKIVDNAPSISEIGLKREITRLSLQGEYAFENDWVVTGTLAYNRVSANWIRDFGLTGLNNWLSRDPIDSQDRTYELRLTGPQESRIRWLAGVSFYSQDFNHRGQGGDATALCIDTFAPGADGECIPANWLFASSIEDNSGNNSDKGETLGIYGAVDIDFTEQWTLSLEGRWQSDEVEQQILDPETAEPTQFKSDFDNFLPRVILRWQPQDRTTVYASYSKGVLPGRANDQVAGASTQARDPVACAAADPTGRACLSEREQYAQAIPGAGEATDEEELDSFEIGLKANLFDNRLNLNLAAYYGEWENQKGRSATGINESCKAPSDLTSTTFDCDFLGDFKKVVGTDQAFFNSRNVDVQGDSEIQGIEVEAYALLTDNWTANFTYGWADTEYTDYFFNFVAPIAGFAEMKGNQMPRYPEHMASFTTTYQRQLRGDWNWFVRGDFSFFGETFVDESNLAKCDSYTRTDGRIGVERQDLRIELWVRNLFDDDDWSACARWTDFDRPNDFSALTRFQGVAITPMDPRQVGIKLVWEFGKE